MHHGKVHPGKVTTELISDSLYCVCDWLLNSIKRKNNNKSSSLKQYTGLICKPPTAASHRQTHTHTHKVLGGVCVCLHVSVCACLDTIKTSSWRRVPMHHPDDSGQAACFAAADIELNDVVLHCGCRGWPAHHWCVAAGFQLGGGVFLCGCVCSGRLNRWSDAEVWRCQQGFLKQNMVCLTSRAAGGGDAGRHSQFKYCRGAVWREASRSCCDITKWRTWQSRTNTVTS